MCEKCHEGTGPVTSNPIDATPFAVWLRSFADDEVVGTATEPSGCPLAQYMLHALGLEQVAVNGDSVAWNTGQLGYRWAKSPDWQATFVRRVDDGGHGLAITAEAALDILIRAADLDENVGLEVLELSLTVNEHATNDDVAYELEVINHV